MLIDPADVSDPKMDVGRERNFGTVSVTVQTQALDRR